MAETVPNGVNRMRPRARLMLTIGLELISSELVAITELVKNAYDADARFVLVRLTGNVVNGTLPAGHGVIEVLDDGVGMSASTVSGTWLVPATPNRKRQRHSDHGRRILGEKGVGRFASAKLAGHLQLTSRQQGQPEVHLALDWSDFEDDDAFLDEIEIEWVERGPRSFSTDGVVGDTWAAATREYLGEGAGSRLGALPRPDQGTLLRLEQTRTDWNRELLSSARTTLSRLVSPFGEEISSDFTIILDAPGTLKDAGGVVGPPDELLRPHYRLDAEVREDGTATGTMVVKDRQPTSFQSRLTNTAGTPASLASPLRSGDFSIHLRVWDRDVPSLNEVEPDLPASSVREVLNDAAGVSIYRDGFRVLPYGEPGDDWLGLDLRRVQSPTRRLSNNQIVGYVLIGRDSNPSLTDQTNREGIVEGAALADLRTAVRQLLLLLENERYKSRPRSGRKRRGGLLDKVDLTELRAVIVERLPNDLELVSMVAGLQTELDRRTEEVGQALARYHRLATLGHLVDRLVHELAQPLLATRQAATLGLERIAKANAQTEQGQCREVVLELERRLTTVQDQAGAASDVLRRIEPFGGRRRGRPPQIDLEQAIADAVALLGPAIEDAGVVVSIPTSSTPVTVDGTELQEVIVNLLTNSVHWLSFVPRESRRIEIRVERNLDQSLSIEVEDSGPGVGEEARDQIFEPYFTTRDGGAGLGLSIAGEIVEDFYGGSLELLTPGTLGGARFRATLRKRVGG